VSKTLSRKTLHKNRAGGVAQGEFKPQYGKKKKKKVFFRNCQLSNTILIHFAIDWLVPSKRKTIHIVIIFGDRPIRR
jgi:hypothetical protein